MSYPSLSSRPALVAVFFLFSALAEVARGLVSIGAGGRKGKQLRSDGEQQAEFWWTSSSEAAVAFREIPAGKAVVSEASWPFRSSQKTEHNETLRHEYMKGKMAIDSSVFDEVATWSRKAKPKGSSDVKKVAFIFMLMDRISWTSIWDKFFDDAPTEQYSIYVHRASIPDTGDKPRLPLKKFGAIPVPWVNSSWCALMGVQVAAMHTALRDHNNEQFVFISQDTVPVKRFSYVYDNLIASSERSKFCFAEPAKHKYAAVEQMSNEVARRCIFRDFYRGLDPHVMKHHEWIVLARRHAHIITKRASEGHQVWAQAWTKAAPDLPSQGEGCSDESVPITTLLLDAREKNRTTEHSWDDLEAMGVEQNCLTFVNWYNCMRKTDFELPGWGIMKSVRERGSDLYKYLTDEKFDFVHETKLNAFPSVYSSVTEKYLRSLTSNGFMFARKFPPDVNATTSTNDPSHFATMLPQLWQEVDEAQALNRTWKRLETAFMPAR